MLESVPEGEERMRKVVHEFTRATNMQELNEALEKAFSHENFRRLHVEDGYGRGTAFVPESRMGPEKIPLEERKRI